MTPLCALPLWWDQMTIPDKAQITEQPKKSKSLWHTLVYDQNANKFCIWLHIYYDFFKQKILNGDKILVIIIFQQNEYSFALAIFSFSLSPQFHLTQEYLS